MKQSRKQLEELAKVKGVTLLQAAPQPAAVVAQPAPGWFADHMPAAAQLLADMKAQLPPEVWKAAMGNLRAGKGYVVDQGARLAIGSPPPEQYERGKSDVRNGFTVVRVTAKVHRP